MLPELDGRLCRLRHYRPADAPALRAIADDFMVARWMTRAFPHPYFESDAHSWIAHSLTTARGCNFAIEVAGAVAGGIGMEPFGGERSGGAAFGYWLGRPYWGRGIATDAVGTFCEAALAGGKLRRLEARVFAPNVASSRVLEKCGFRLEGRLHEFYVDRENRVCDALSYARLARDG